MSERIVPELKANTFEDCSFENCDIGPDDIDWCTGFWNEMAGEITPSLYPDSPIFSTKEYDWDDPVFLENVLFTPNVEETFAGSHLNGHPAFMEDKTKEETYLLYSSSNVYEPDSTLEVGLPTNTSKSKSKRQGKLMTENVKGTPSKRPRTYSTKKTKQKTKK